MSNTMTYEYLSSVILNALGIITLFLLGLATLRDVLIKFNLTPPKGNWGYRFFSVSYEKNIVKNALKELGYSKDKSTAIFESNESTSEEVNSNILGDSKQNLIALMANYTYKLKCEREYGSETPRLSSYYIHTMELVHNRDNLIKITNIMYDLILNTPKYQRFDFIIVPKGGNPLLALSVAKKFGVNLLVLKSEDDPSSLKISTEEDYEDFFRVNFEGGNELLNKKAKSNKKLRGIVIDCNTSGGSQLYYAMDTFNKVADTKVINAHKVVFAYVLFRADDGVNKFDDKALDNPEYELKRYYDFNEVIKNELYELGKKHNNKLNYITKVKKDDINAFCKSHECAEKNIVLKK